ncbi:DUF5119 domain-containing protein [Bacteroides sp.]
MKSLTPTLSQGEGVRMTRKMIRHNIMKYIGDFPPSPWERVGVRLLLFTLLSLSACDRRELTYYSEVEITITVDWSRAGLEEESSYGATAIFYPQDGSEPKTVLMGDRRQATARLPEGRYNVVLFNRSFEDFAGIAFRGQEGYATLEAYAKKVESRAQTRTMVYSPEVLATDIIEGFEVTPEMIEEYGKTASTRSEVALTFTPRRLTRTLQVQISIEGLSNIKEAKCRLDGLPLSVFLAGGTLSAETAAQEFALGNPLYPAGSQTNGTMSGEVNVFGFSQEQPHTIEFSALLLDGQTVAQEVTNVTVKEETDATGTVVLRIEAVAPERMPDIEVGSGGMDAEVGDWDKEEHCDIPL